MNPQFRATSAFLRSVFILAAGVANVLIAASIYGLTVHYSADARVEALPTVVAQR